ncbi:Tesmin/TSO1-like CXC domain protein [Dictyocaulus viviparus]|uniref:Tesmin/TSO1-like CXC domain protein n=1 Tax=Dictyocaulus viviparus TaxID=29172 RepID=A0A0D8XKU2_DICVI|nr:Tesmin/TSO1-like CXC domain protein [Dictyocaulus viviparus]
MAKANGECLHDMENNREPLIFEQVLVGEDGEPIYIEGEEDYGVFRDEEYIQLEDGTFVQAEQHSIVPQTSQSSESQMLQVQLAPMAQRLAVEPGSRFQSHAIHQQQNYVPRVPQEIEEFAITATFHMGTSQINQHTLDCTTRQSYDFLDKSNIFNFTNISSSKSKAFSPSPSSSTIYQMSSTNNLPKPRKKPLPGQRKPCNCTKSMCLKLYCDCFANGEFCLDCNCKDCHNNLEHDADRSKAIKQSLERNPNAFKPKIGVKSGKVDAERLHQKGCHCKKSGCLKNYCECFEAKVPCTSRCKCQGCQNTEGDRVNRNERTCATSSALMSLANAASSLTTGSPSSPLSENDSDPESSSSRFDPRSYPWFYMTDEVIEAATLCLVAQAEESLSGCPGEINDGVVEEMERMVLGEFGRCLQEIISNASEV